MQLTLPVGHYGDGIPDLWLNSPHFSIPPIFLLSQADCFPWSRQFISLGGALLFLLRFRSSGVSPFLFPTIKHPARLVLSPCFGASDYPISPMKHWHFYLTGPLFMLVPLLLQFCSLCMRKRHKDPNDETRWTPIWASRNCRIGWIVHIILSGNVLCQFQRKFASGLQPPAKENSQTTACPFAEVCVWKDLFVCCCFMP